MSIIIKQLEELGIAKEQIPKAILNKIDHLEGMKDALTDTRQEYAEEQDPEVRQEMHELIAKAEQSISDLETMIDDAVKAFKEKLRNEPVANTDNSADEPAGNSNDEPVKPPVSRKPVSNDEPKKSSAWKYVLGGVVLLVTLGAVNTLNQK
jgi:hypothetical protein